MKYYIFLILFVPWLRLGIRIIIKYIISDRLTVQPPGGHEAAATVSQNSGISFSLLLIFRVRVREREHNDPPPLHPTTGWLDNGNAWAGAHHSLTLSHPLPSLESNCTAPRRPWDSCLSRLEQYYQSKNDLESWYFKVMVGFWKKPMTSLPSRRSNIVTRGCENKYKMEKSK